MSRKCISISYEFLEDLLGISREEGRILSTFGDAARHSLQIYYETPSGPESTQDSEAFVTQTLRAQSSRYLR